MNKSGLALGLMLWMLSLPIFLASQTPSTSTTYFLVLIAEDIFPPPIEIYVQNGSYQVHIEEIGNTSVISSWTPLITIRDKDNMVVYQSSYPWPWYAGEYNCNCSLSGGVYNIALEEMRDFSVRVSQIVSNTNTTYPYESLSVVAILFLLAGFLVTVYSRFSRAQGFASS